MKDIHIIMYYHTRLTIILLTCTYVSASDLTHLRCPSSSSNCTMAHPKLWDKNVAFFNLGGLTTLTVRVNQSEKIEYKCSPPLDLASYLKSFPKFDDVHQFESVTLNNCNLPQGSYGTTLDALNVTGFHNLTLTFESCNQKPLLPPDHFVRLRDLVTLHISCSTFDNASFDFIFLNRLQYLKNLELMGVTIPPFSSWNLLQLVTMTSGAPLKNLQRWGGCKKLEELKIVGWVVTELPESWLANCSRLTSIHLEGFEMINSLPRYMVNSTYLRSMKLIKLYLRDLPNDLFDHARNLHVLDLSGNRLNEIKSKMLTSLLFLEELVLTENLVVNFSPEYPNTRISDTKIADGICKTEWPLLASLERLSLKRCNVIQMCSQWNQSMPKLKQLNLAKTWITELKYQDIEMIRFNGWNVDLRDSSLEAIVFTESDYEAVLNLSLAPSNASIELNHYPYICDCRWYWFARTVKEHKGYLTLPNLFCKQQWGKQTDPVLLKKMALESFLCEDDNCEAGCHCFNRAPDNTTQINCTGAGLDHIPRVPLLRELHLAYNNIRTIHAYDLPETLEYMDLQNNQLSTVDMKIASMMFNRSTIIYNLANNQIVCDCNNSALINLLQAHKNQLENYEYVTCADGSPLENANTFILCLEQHVPVIAGVLGTIALLCIIIMTLYYRYRTQIYAILYAWGWCACCVNEQELDKDKLYDVFISFAFEDTSFVMDQLVPELEKEPHAFTVCMHHRDWMPGEWIPSQIAHSVQQSRRTVVILSKNFLSSIWALLEFRTAHIQAIKDGRVRLIIVLLGDVITDEGMDDELRAYLSTNTYIKWGDGLFWDKLRYALPHRKRGGHREWGEQDRRAAGEEVLGLVRPSDPSIALRNIVPSHMLSIEPAQIEEVQE